MKIFRKDTERPQNDGINRLRCAWPGVGNPSSILGYSWSGRDGEAGDFLA